MIKNYNPLPFSGSNPLPNYVGNITKYELIGYAPGGYRVTLAKMVAGDSISAGTALAHVLFKSFNDHGEPAKETRTRVSGYDKEFIAARSAMVEAGIEFFPMISCTNEELMKALGDWFEVHNPDITETSVVSQTCH